MFDCVACVAKNAYVACKETRKKLTYRFYKFIQFLQTLSSNINEVIRSVLKFFFFNIN